MVASHLWTLGPRLRHALRRARSGGERRWETSVADERWGRVRLSGAYEQGSGDDLLLVVHGLGGSTSSHYMGPITSAAAAAGLSVLRLNLRGSDLSGEDFYHAGLTADVAAALASPEVAAHARVLLVGYSLGGHVALRYVAEGADARVRAVAAVCAPLDLAPAQRAIDSPGAWLYRRYLLDRLGRIYAAVAERRQLPLSGRDAARIRTIRAWDEAVVAPRWGFAGADDYYARASVGPLLPRLDRPALLVGATGDPMVPRACVERAAPAAPALEVRWSTRGGHVGFPADLDLGLGPRRGLEGQLLAWLERAS